MVWLLIFFRTLLTILSASFLKELTVEVSASPWIVIGIEILRVELSELGYVLVFVLADLTAVFTALLNGLPVNLLLDAELVALFAHVGTIASPTCKIDTVSSSLRPSILSRAGFSFLT